MKKIIITILIAFFLIGIVTAGVLINKTIKTNVEREAIAIELGIDVYDYEDEDCSSGGIRRCLISKSDYNLPCSICMEKEILDDWEEEYMNELLQVELDRKVKRENPEIYTKTQEGETTITK